MARMKKQWDEETQLEFTDELIEDAYPDDGQRCDRTPFEDLDRQPDISILDGSGAVSEYAYLLQPAEVTADFFQSFPEDSLDDVTFFVPHHKTDIPFEELGQGDSRVKPYRINCGLIQVL